MAMVSIIDRTGMELRNGRTKIVIDRRTGTVLRIEDAMRGLVHLDANRGGRGDGRLFRLIIPGEIWWSCYADSQEQAQVKCAQNGNSVILEYPDLKAADGLQTGVAIRVEIQPGEMPDEFQLSMQIENCGPRTVMEVTFPLLGGWHEPGKQSRIALGANHFIAPRSLATTSGDTYAYGDNYARNGRRGGWHYPVDLACPWVDISGPEGGFAYLNYMTEGRNGKFWIENLAGYGDDFRLMFGWSHFVALRPGDSWTSPFMGLAVHDSDWRATADRYRAWFDAQHPPDYSRPAIRGRIGYQNVFFRGFDGTPFRAFETIPQVAAVGRRYGIDMLSIWDTLTIGNYARYDPHDLTDYGPEERERLQRGLRQARVEGTQTCVQINFRHPNVALHLSEPDMPNRIQRRFTGTFRTENCAVNHTFGDLWARHIGPESYVFSPFSAAHRERVLRLTRDCLDLGYSSMLYDQPFEIHPDYGFTDKGQPPDATHHEALQLVGEVRKLLLARDSKAVVIGEYCDIYATPYIDQWVDWSIAAPSPQLIERVSMMRYAIPSTILSWALDHEPERAAIAFAMGMQLCLMVHGAEGTLAEEPLFAERVKALADLRQKTADRTVMAQFRGQNGLKVDGDSNFTAFAYDSATGPAVIVAACGAHARGKVTVAPEVFTVQTRPAEGAVFHLNSSQVAHTGTTREFDLEKNEVAVWTL